ncbi:hypothetical protein Cfor_10369, partial [Coptotermes formosanus]
LHLALPEFHFFGVLKDALKGRRFAKDYELNPACTKSYDTSATFYTTGIERQVPRWQKCVDNGGHFVEK